MPKRLAVKALPALAGSLLVNMFLIAVAALLVSERAAPQDMTDPVGVKLIELTPPAPPEPEEVKEPPRPKPQPKFDFAPDLVRPDLSAPSGLDMGVVIDMGQFEGGDVGDEFVFEAYELDQAPQPVVRVPPVYPYGARERGIEGVVQVKLLVNADGSVGQVQIMDARPKGVFEEAVMNSVPQWRFNPGKIEGKAVTAWVVTAVRFDLN
jgi:protein TonB